MKKINKPSRATAMFVVMFVALGAMLSSFTMPGAHSFQLYVGNKMILDQYVTREFSVAKVTLSADERDSQIILKYSECGRTVAGRTLTIKDEQDKILREWHFDGSTSGYKDPMTLSVKDIVALKPNKGDLKLFYTSNDFKQGQQVAYLVVGKDITAAMK